MTGVAERISDASTRVCIAANVALAAAYDLTDNPYLDVVVREITATLASHYGHVVDGRQVLDAVTSLVDVVQRQEQLADNPAEYLTSLRLPVTGEQVAHTTADLASDRAHWLSVLLEIGATS